MPYTRYGHVNQIFVKVGDRVKQGDRIATNGNAGGLWSAHCHVDHPLFFPGGNYGFYNIGWTKAKTLETFEDPYKYPKVLGAGFSHLGYDWLEYATYSTGKCYHPGIDENGAGAGNADYDAPIYAITDGTVEYIYSGTGGNGGWGHLIVIKEEESMNKEFVKVVSDLAGKDYGDNLNDGEQQDAAKRLKTTVSDLKLALEEEKNKPPLTITVEKEVPVEVIKEVKVLESDMTAVDLFRLALKKFLQ